jgi:hypothetical protein
VGEFFAERSCWREREYCVVLRGTFTSAFQRPTHLSRREGLGGSHFCNGTLSGGLATNPKRGVRVVGDPKVPGLGVARRPPKHAQSGLELDNVERDTNERARGWNHRSHRTDP